MAVKKENAKGPKDFDDVLALVGDFGKYQIFLIVVILIPTSFFVSLIVNLMLFQTTVPEKYWCDPPGREETNFTQEEWWNLTVPRNDEGDFEKCLQYDFDVVEVVNHSISVNVKNNNDTKQCVLEWTHDKLTFQESVGTSMGYYCDKEIYSTHIFSFHTIGAIIGTFLLPIIADKYTGRRMMFFISSGIHLVFHIIFLVVPIYGVQLFARLCEGIPYQTDYQMPYIIGLELMAPEKRALASFFSFVAWTAGMCFTAFIAWIIPHWWYMQLIMIITSLIFFLYWRILPPSPRWLLSKCRYDDCLDILMKVAKVNGKEVNRMKLEHELKSCNCETEEEKIDIKTVLKHKIILFRGVLLMIYSFVVMLVYGCTLFYVDILPGNTYLSFFVLSASELPSNIISSLSVHYLGRRFTAISTMVISLIFSITAPFVLKARSVLLFVVAMIKIFITQGIYVVYIMTCEVFPTSMRSIGMGSVVVFSMAGLFVSKYIVQASGDGPFQYWVMVGTELVGLLVAIPIPETIGLALPQTLPEANNLGKNRPFFKWIHHWNKGKFSEDRTNKINVKNAFE
ncbi:UNVERIFIED_CONTAM: hypothetical protein RMT77_000271 [Armadillidium vulgare]